MPPLSQLLADTINFIRSQTKLQPTVGIVLGSGLGRLADEVTDAVAIPYEKIPHFPVSTVHGHGGKLVFGTLAGKTVVVMQGRFHHYEGYSLSEVTYPIRVMRALGVEDLVITNASGGLNRNYRVGDLMLMSDHINLMGSNPLIGANDEKVGPRFPPMQGAYDAKLLHLATDIGRELGAPVQQGVYVAVTGPSYETAAELRMLRVMGADAVGMSTVPEVIVAKHGGMRRVLGISCITDMATGEGHEDVNHEMVLDAAKKAQPYFLELVRRCLAKM